MYLKLVFSILLMSSLILTSLSVSQVIANDHKAHNDSHNDSHQAAPAATSKGDSRWFYQVFWDGLLAKLAAMQTLDEDNVVLRHRVAELEVANAQLEFELGIKQEAKRAAQIKAKALKEAGSENARTLASIMVNDKHFANQSPKMIYQQAQKAFDHEDYATATQGFYYLANHPENTTYQNITTFYYLTVGFYKLGNVYYSNQYADQVLALASSNKAYQGYGPKVFSWKILNARRANDKKLEQQLIHQLIQRYPKSREASLVNRHA